MNSRRDFFESFFGEDPFENMDRAFGQMHSMFDGTDPFFAPPPMRAQNPRRPYYGNESGPVIEEIHGEDEFGSNPTRGRGPIVEEPDDGHPNNINRRHQPPERRSHFSHGPHRNAQTTQSGMGIQIGMDGIPQIMQFGNGGGMSSSTMVSYSSSYSSGQGGTVYSSSSVTRMGPGGVMESQSSVRDGRTGQESITISRGLGDRQRTIRRTRGANGREESQDVLHNINEGQTGDFEREWAQEAGRQLPSMSGRPQLDHHQHHRSARQHRPQLGYGGSGGRYV